MDSPEQNKDSSATDFFTEDVIKEEMSEFFLFDIEGELYAVLISEVDRVMKVPPVTTVPNAPDSIVGVFHLRGKVIVVLDLLKRMHLTRQRALVPNYLFVVHHEKNYFGIPVDQTLKILRIPTKQVTALDQAFSARIPPRYAKGMFVFEEFPFEETHKTYSDFMIKPPNTEGTPIQQSKMRPVLFLNIQEILNQADLVNAFPQQ